MRINKAYTYLVSNSVAPGVNNVFRCRINRNLQSFNVKSINWDYKIEIPAIPKKLSINTAENFSVVLGVGALGLSQVANSFESTLIPVGATIVNGTLLTYFNPGVYVYDNFIAQTYLDFEINFTNLDAVDTLNFMCSLIVEIL